MAFATGGGAVEGQELGKQCVNSLISVKGLRLTKRDAVSADKALIRNNVKVGGEVALEYARLLKEVR